MKRDLRKMRPSDLDTGVRRIDGGNGIAARMQNVCKGTVATAELKYAPLPAVVVPRQRVEDVEHRRIEIAVVPAVALARIRVGGKRGHLLRKSASGSASDEAAPFRSREPRPR